MLVVVVCQWRWEGDSGGCVNDWSCRHPGGGGGGGGHAGGCRVIEGGGKAVVMAGSLMQVIVDDNDIGIWDLGLWWLCGGVIVQWWWSRSWRSRVGLVAVSLSLSMWWWCLLT